MAMRVVALSARPALTLIERSMPNGKCNESPKPVTVRKVIINTGLVVAQNPRNPTSANKSEPIYSRSDENWRVSTEPAMRPIAIAPTTQPSAIAEAPFASPPLLRK